MPGPYPGQPPTGGPGRSVGGAPPVALIGAGAMLLLEAVLLLLTLVSAQSPGQSLLGLFGLSDHWAIDAPTQFTSGDIATCAVLVAGIIGLQGGRTWGRPVIMATMGLVAYPMATLLLSQVVSSEGRHYLTEGHNLWFNLLVLVELFVAAGTLAAGLATSRSGAPAAAASGPAAMPGPVPGQAPVPGQGQPFPQQQPAPGYAPPQGQPGYPAQPMPQQPAPGYAPPQGQPGPGYSPPPVPPQAGPGRQPSPAQDNVAYQPTQYAPRPGQPGQPPAQPGA
ncbi:hypothetical protein [Streptacidiphilus pinicola]|nr:hypothetical protein [Streptacidiphilus pinicola]